MALHTSHLSLGFAYLRPTELGALIHNKAGRKDTIALALAQQENLFRKVPSYSPPISYVPRPSSPIYKRKEVFWRTEQIPK